MPWALRKLCAFGGCGALTRAHYCPDHERVKRRAYDQNRPSSTKRGYGRRWAKLRMMVLRRQPVCPCGALATEVDHINPKRQGGEDSFENLQGLCKPCHSRKTVRGT